MAAPSTTARTTLRLAGWFASSTTNRVRMALTIKGIPFEYQHVDIKGNATRTKEYQSTLNMLSQIPVLFLNADTDHPTAIRQSVAILEYIEEAYPETTPLLPRNDPVKRAQVREIVEIVNSYTQPMQNKKTVEEVAEHDPKMSAFLARAVGGHTGDVTEVKFETNLELWPHRWMDRGFQAIEGIIRNTSGRFCFGDDITYADVCLLGQVMGAKFYWMDMTVYPTICKVCRNMQQVPAVQKALSDTPVMKWTF